MFIMSFSSSDMLEFCRTQHLYAYGWIKFSPFLDFDDYLFLLFIFKDLKINQKTPLRVLHRYLLCSSTFLYVFNISLCFSTFLYVFNIYLCSSAFSNMYSTFLYVFNISLCFSAFSNMYLTFLYVFNIFPCNQYFSMFLNISLCIQHFSM